MKINLVKCKTALSKSNLPGLDYSLNPYRGCQHNCAYCYVPNVLRIKRENWGNFVDIKTNIPNILAKELKNKKNGTVGISTVTDPYQPAEKKHKLTKYCLEQLLKHDFPICIQTKSDLIIRDTDLISKFTQAEVMVSIGTINDDERKKLEPQSSPIQNRLKILENFSNMNIKTSVFFGPVYPTITIEDLPKIIDVFIDNGATEIMVDKFNLKPGILENLENYIPEQINKTKDVSYFKLLFNEMCKISKNKNIKIISAF